MSADNWAHCPKCQSSAEYHEEQESLREDYEIGIWDNRFIIDYRAKCQNDDCDFVYTYQVKKVIQ